MMMTLITLLIFTLSGLMVMDMAILEELAVSNEQRSLQVYQTAYSELDAQMVFLRSNPTVMAAAVNGNQILTPIVAAATCTNPGDICQTVTLRYTGQASPPTGYSITSFIGLNFELDSVAVLNGAAATSSQTLGFVYVTPKAGP